MNIRIAWFVFYYMFVLVRNIHGADDLCFPVSDDCVPLEPDSPCSKTCGKGTMTIRYRCDEGTITLTGECCLGPCTLTGTKPVTKLCRDCYPMCMATMRNPPTTTTTTTTPNPNNNCEYTTCEECKADHECEWKISSKKCLEKSIWNIGETVSGSEMCPCEECEEWYTSDDEKDMTWLTDLNTNFKCPCQCNFGVFGCDPVNKQGQEWTTDWACASKGLPWCGKFHPGAYGCIRSKDTSTHGARQQCCYSKNGALLPPNHPGAGTPDKSGDFWEHQDVDVEPWEWCCDECEQNYCGKYRQKRLGDNTHC